MRARLYRFMQLLSLVVVLGAFVAPRGAVAEPLGRFWELTPFGGFTLFDGDLKHVVGDPLTDDIYLGLRFGYQYHPLLGFELAAGYTPTSTDVNLSPKDVDFLHGSANLMFTPWNGRVGGPFLFGGWGYHSISPASGDAESETAFEVGGGLRFWMTDAVGIRLEARQPFYTQGNPDGTESKINDMILGGGIALAFGGTPRDTDGDGVPDKTDKCPGTPKGARVDASGCPTDGDGDAVFDGLDRCPDTPKGATVDSTGCPSDTDGDGVFAGLDRCADTPRGATVDASGCPMDSDGDGVFDGLDRCPGTPKGAVIDSVGCPIDSDGDGVFNGLDQCPDTPAGIQVDAAGCPVELIERETEMLDTGMIRLQDVNFETGKADLLPESLPALDVVGTILTKWPELKIEIGGHTDSRGSNATNQKLSERRAQSVEKYLLGKFPNLKDAQFSSKGYGESKPVVPNNNDLNMAKNRRVEFVVTNKDVLKRETERRRLLQKGEATPVPGTTPAPADTTKR